MRRTFQQIHLKESYATDHLNACIAVCEANILKQRLSVAKLLEEHKGFDLMPENLQERCKNNLKSANDTELLIQAINLVLESKDDRITYQSGLIANKLMTASITQAMKEVLSVDDFTAPVTSVA